MKRIFVTVMLAFSATVCLMLSTIPASAESTLQRASGGGTFAASGNDFLFAFTARQVHQEGHASGQFEFHNRTNGSLIHMAITYAAFDGNRVWLGGVITKVVGANAEVGDERVVSLQDNGEGVMAQADLLSKLSNQAAANAVDMPGLALFALTTGNIQIR